MIKIDATSKIQSDSGKDVVRLEMKVEGTQDTILRELITILGAFEQRMPDLLMTAIAYKINEEELEGMDNEDD